MTDTIMSCVYVLFLLVGGACAFFIFIQKNLNDQARRVAARTEKEMRPFLDSYSDAVSSADPKKLTEAAHALLQAARYWHPGTFGRLAEEV